MTKKWYLGWLSLVTILIGIVIISMGANLIVNAIAQSGPAPGQVKETSLVGPLGISVQDGPRSAYVLVTGGTVTCTNGGTPSVSNTNVDAGSAIILTLKTVGGTPAVPIVTTITAGTGFSITCGASDSSTYNYVVIG